MNAAGEFFVHLRVGAGAATLACKVMEGGDLVSVGVALCSPRDQFSRKLGRKIAAGRRWYLGSSRATKAFTFAIPNADKPLRDHAIDAFTRWLDMPGRAWWLDVLEDAPTVQLWPGAVQRHHRQGRRA